MMHYCTSFNQVYLLRGLALYQSLVEHSSEPFTLWVLCFDERSFDILTRLQQPNLKPVALATLEAADPALLVAKQNRSMVEYFFTCSPIWPLYLLKHEALEQITYLDADLFFFADPQLVFDEMGSASILIIPHRFPAHMKHLERNGIYNVGLLSFRNDASGLACLQWWRERVLEWCYDRIEDGKFADQKYLDDWPTRFQNVHVLQHKGANLAPWNVMNYAIRQTTQGIWVDDDPLIFYHYQGIKLINQLLYDPAVFQYGITDSAAKKLLYPVYIRALASTLQWAKKSAPDLQQGYSGMNSRSYSFKTFLYRLTHGHLMLTASR